jgi:signal transduction histidine kinase
MECQENEILAKPVITNLFVDKNLKQKDRFSRLRSVHKLQRSIVRQNMHNVMSPISAISGYLELINMSLSQDPDVEQIEYYRKKIELGIEEVNTIMEQLQGIYNDETDNCCKESDTMLDVDLNWIVREVCTQNRFMEQNIEFSTNANPLHVHTDIFIAKLILFNLISYAVKNSPKDELVELVTNKGEQTAGFSVAFKVQEKKVKELKAIITGKGLYDLDEHVLENSFNEGLMNSTHLANEIEGVISFLHDDNGLSKLKLTIPLAQD